MERKFKIGDIVIGNSGANIYGITEEGYKARVVDNLNFNKIRITPTLEGPHNKNYFNVEEIHFDLLKKCVNNQDELLKEALERYPIGTIIDSSNILEVGCTVDIRSKNFQLTTDGHLIYVDPRRGVYSVYNKNLGWADTKVKIEDTSSEPRFKVGDFVYIRRSSHYRSQGIDQEGNSILGTILDVRDGDGYKYRIEWEGTGRKNDYREKDIFPAHKGKFPPELEELSMQSKKPHIPWGTKEHNKGKLFIGKNKYDLGWMPAELHPLHTEGRRVEVLTNSFATPIVKKAVKTTSSLEFQKPVIVKKTTGNKFKLITII